MTNTNYFTASNLHFLDPMEKNTNPSQQSYKK